MVPCSVISSDINATRPPPPAPPELLKKRVPASRLSAPEASPPFTSRTPWFIISLATILRAPPDPEPPEKLAPDVGLTNIVPPFMEMRTS